MTKRVLPSDTGSDPQPIERNNTFIKITPERLAELDRGRRPYEEEKPTCLKEFQETLSKCVKEDYHITGHGTGLAFFELLSRCQNNTMIFGQMKEIFLEAAVKAGNERDVVSKELDDFWKVTEPDDYNYKPIENLIYLSVNHDKYKDKVILLPLICGSGKSTNIRHMIRDTIETKTNGILIVTDTKEMLDSYIKERNENDKEESDTIDYFDKHKNNIKVLKNENGNTNYDNIRKCAVLLMTTQRYFQSQKSDIINKFLSWNGGFRSIIIFDERAYVKEQVSLSRPILLDIQKAVLEGIPSSRDNIDNKIKYHHIIRSFVNRFIDELHVLEELFADSEKGRVFLDPQRLNVDCGLLKQALGYAKEKIKRNTESYMTSLYENIRIIEHFLDHGGIASVINSNGYYRTSVNMIRDNSDLLLNLTKNGQNARVVIMDGTGYIHPDFQNRDWIYTPSIVGIKYRRSLEFLKLHIIPFDTSKKTLTRNSESQAHIMTLKRFIMDAIDKSESKEKPVIFTYKEIQATFKKFTDPRNEQTTEQIEFEVEHFGNIKGRNDWRERGNFIQIGLLRLPEPEVIAYTLSENPEIIERIKNITDYKEQNEYLNFLFESGGELNEQYNEIQVRYIVSDIEQNIWRGRIRNDNNCKQMDYYLIIPHDNNYDRICRMLEDRIGGLRGNVIKEHPLELQSPEKQETDKDRFYKFYNSKEIGEQFTIKEIYEELNIEKPKKWDKIKDRYPDIQKLMQDSTIKKGLFKRIV